MHHHTLSQLQAYCNDPENKMRFSPELRLSSPTLTDPTLPKTPTFQFYANDHFQRCTTSAIQTLINNPHSAELPDMMWSLSGSPIAASNLIFSLGWATLTIYKTSGLKLSTAAPASAATTESVVVFSNGLILRPTVLLKNPTLLSNDYLSSIQYLDTTQLSAYILAQTQQELLKAQAAVYLSQAAGIPTESERLHRDEDIGS